MKTWRDKILEQFIPKIAKLSLVSDPDNLLTEEKTAVKLKERGFDILEFTDAIEFRYAYEFQYRAIWDNGIDTELVVILHTHESILDNLPYDLLETGKKFYFSIPDIFPIFDRTIIEKLDKTFFDILYSVRDKFPKEKVADKSTIDFILRYVYKIDTDSIIDELELIKILLDIHFGNLKIHELFLQRFEYLIQENKIFSMMPINKLIYDKDFFIEFLIEKHKDIIISSPEVQLIKISDNKIKNIDKLFSQIENIKAESNLSHREWISIAWKYAYLGSFVYINGDTNYIQKYETLFNKTNELYENWLATNYAGLITIPAVSPAMVHHIPHFLAFQYRQNKIPVALIIIDGLALNQWITLYDSLSVTNIRIEENALFAWIPTLTSVSRQSIFSGKRPLDFENSIQVTEKEKKLWLLFWENNGFSDKSVLYQKGVDTDEKIIELENNLIQNKVQIAGLVLNKIDDIMHGNKLGMEDFHRQIQFYGEKGTLSELIKKLIDNNFEVWITSDHGNIECIGKGKPNEASIARSRGERVRIYKSESILKSIKKDFPWTDYWKPVGLPKEYLSLIARGNYAFLPKNTKAISHGGISMQETIVPFIKITRK